MLRFGIVLALAAALDAQVAVHGDKVYTMAGAAIDDGVVLIRDGKIERVGPASQVNVPEGYKTLRAKVVTPGLVDAHGTVGLTGYLNQPQDQDELEKSAPIQPELRAIDAYDGRDRLVSLCAGVRRDHDEHRARAGRVDFGPDDGGEDGV